MQRFSPLLWTLRDVRFQPIDTRDVATRLVSLIDSEPAGRATDIGGPSVHSHPELGQMYLSKHNSVRRVARFTIPGRIVVGYRSGANLTPENAVDGASFPDYLGTSG